MNIWCETNPIYIVACEYMSVKFIHKSIKKLENLIFLFHHINSGKPLIQVLSPLFSWFLSLISSLRKKEQNESKSP